MKHLMVCTDPLERLKLMRVLDDNSKAQRALALMPPVGLDLSVPRPDDWTPPLARKRVKLEVEVEDGWDGEGEQGTDTHAQ